MTSRAAMEREEESQHHPMQTEASSTSKEPCAGRKDSTLAVT